MAIVNKTITNPKTGQTYKFIQTTKSSNGELLEIESSFRPHSKEPPAHYHPYQAEDFTILEGELTVKLDSEIRILKTGDTIHIPARQIHSMWNDSDQKAVVNWKTRPALESEYLFETIVGLANDNKTDASGKPGLLQTALTINKFSNSFQLVKPPLLIQKILFNILTPFALLSGKKSTYKKYID